MMDAKKHDDDPKARSAADASLDPLEIADADLDAVTGGLMSPGGAGTVDTSVCLSKT